MKKIILSVVAILAVDFANAQEKLASTDSGQTATGKWLIEANTNFGAGHVANTNFQFASSDGNTAYNIGLEGGYFVIDDLAIKAGLGYGTIDPKEGETMSMFSYKIGAKYYIISAIPVQIDYSGSDIKDATENPSYFGIQGGYAIFLGDNVSIEPGLRYDISLNNDFYKDVFQLNVGFALHF